MFPWFLADSFIFLPQSSWTCIYLRRFRSGPLIFFSLILIIIYENQWNDKILNFLQKFNVEFYVYIEV
jgi:hypothetical protein